MKNSPSDRNRILPEARDPSSLFAVELSELDWLERLRDFVAPDPLDSIGSYEGVEEVSRGGQGIIYRARQPGTGRQVALKRMLAGSLSGSAARARFQREAEAAASLNHPGIVTVYGLEEVDGLPVYAMEWIEGEPITAWARREGRTLDEILRAFLQVCDAVRHAHQRGVLHRDLKPSNLLVDREGRPRVLDFGLAKRVTEGAADATRTQGFVGTPAYAAPEQIEGANELVDARSDVYSLGVVLYEMLTGTRPYRPEDGMLAFADALEHERYARPSTVRRELAREIDSIVATAIAADPDERYQSVDALGADVGRFLAHEPVEAHGSGSWYALVKIARRHRAVFALSALLAVTAIGSAIFFAVQAERLAVKRDEALAARESERMARREADALALAEREAREEAERESARAEAVLVFMLQDVVGAAANLPNQSIREAVDKAENLISARFVDDPVAEGFVRFSIGRMYSAMEEDNRAAEQFVRAFELLDAHGRPIESAKAAAWLIGTQRTNAQSEEAIAELRELAANLSTDNEAVEGVLVLRIRVVSELIEKGTPEALAEAEREIQENFRFFERLFPDGLELVGSMLNSQLARVFEKTGRRQEAESLREKILNDLRVAYGEGLPQQSAIHLEVLSAAALRRREFVEAESLASEAVEVIQRTRGEGYSTLARVELLRSKALWELGRVEEAVALCEKAWDSIRAASEVHPEVLSSCRYHLGFLYLMSGTAGRAVEHLQESSEFMEQKYGSDSKHALNAKGFLGLALFHAGNVEASVEPLTQGMKSLSGEPSTFRTRSTDWTFRHLVAALVRTGDRGALEAAFEQRVSLESLSPEQARVHLEHARLLREIYFDAERAQSLERKARELDPATVDAWERELPVLLPWQLDPSDPLTQLYGAR